jgi:DNA polymerase-1
MSLLSEAQFKEQTIIDFMQVLDDYQKLQKQSSTYIIGLIPHVKEGRIYTTLQLHTTVTGRPSSTEPNLLNITRTKEGLPDIRKLFVARDGWKIVQADYSQAELRCIAYFSQDPELMEVYTNGLDLHARTATEFFGSGFTPEQRSIAKNCNFGMFYEQSAATFREKHGIDPDIAQRYIDWAHKAFPAVWAWEADVKKKVHEGAIVSPFGRKRRFHLLTKENRNESYRMAINFYPQSTAADFTLLSLVSLLPEIDPTKAKVALTVYDSIISEVRDDYIDEYSDIIRPIMESRPRDELGWTIPFKADIGVGQTWAEAK